MLRLNRIGCGALRSGTGGSLGPTTTSCGVPALRWSTLTSQPPIFELKNADIYPFGVSTEPLFRQLSWTIGNSDCWAVMSSQTTSASTHNAEDLTGVVQAHARVSPSSAGIYPILKALPPIPRPASEGGPRERDIGDIIHFVSFKTSLSRTGDFDDYTARYGHIRAEDATTVRQHLMQSLPSHVADATSVEGSQLVDDTARLLQIDHLLDLPLITLSNGQTRRARILRALLHQPELLILEEPFSESNRPALIFDWPADVATYCVCTAGLDVNSRFLLASLLSKLHAKRAPRIMLILRPQDTPLPPFISHLALVGPERGQVLLGSKEDVLETRQGRALIERGRAAVEQAEQKKVAAADRQRRRTEQDAEQSRGEPLVVLNKVNITYGTPEAPRRILHDIDWTIRAGERWLLVGHNGALPYCRAIWKLDIILYCPRFRQEHSAVRPSRRPSEIVRRGRVAIWQGACKSGDGYE